MTFGDEAVELLGVEGQALGDDPAGDHAVDLAPQLVDRKLLDGAQVELLDEALVQPHLGLEQFLVRRRGGGGLAHHAQERRASGRRWRGRRRVSVGHRGVARH
jgi:hypothetical protein